MAAATLAQKALSDRVIRSFFEAYWELGGGFAESLYSEALSIVFAEHGIEFVRAPSILVHFRGHTIGIVKPDFVIEDHMIVELKAIPALDKRCEAQLLNYLRATKIEVGLLLNFGLRAQFKRMVYSNDRKVSLPREAAESS